MFLPGGEYTIDLRTDSTVGMNVVSETASGRSVTIRVTMRGKGLHRVTLRADGIVFPQASKELVLHAGVDGMVEFKAGFTKEPWVVLVVPDGHWEEGKEVKNLTPP
jgi:hypothetical protein